MTRIPIRPEQAVLTLSSRDPNGLGGSVECFFKWIEGEQLIIVSQLRPRVPSRVSVEHCETLFIGEAIRSVPVSKGWRSEIRVAEIQSGTRTLINLGKRLRREDVRLPQEQARNSLMDKANSLGSSIPSSATAECDNAQSSVQVASGGRPTLRPRSGAFAESVAR